MKRTLPLVVGFLSGFIVILKYFVDEGIIAKVGTEIVGWRITVAAFALGLGAANLVQVHARAIARRERNWDSSLLLLATLAVFTVVGIAFGTNAPAYKWFWDNVYQPIYSAIASLLAFMIITASYRAFRVRNWQSAVLMVSALIVILGQIGVGGLIYSGLPGWSQWLMAIPNAAGMRGITIGGALGAVALSLRVLLGFERSYMGGA